MQKSVIGTRMTETPLPDVNISASYKLQSLKPIYTYLETLDKWVDEIPPVEQPMRFGNKAFRTWYDKVIAVSRFYQF